MNFIRNNFLISTKSYFIHKKSKSTPIVPIFWDDNVVDVLNICSKFQLDSFGNESVASKRGRTRDWMRRLLGYGSSEQKWVCGNSYIDITAG